jgi:DNA-binding MarR family transcriptional regulator
MKREYQADEGFDVRAEAEAVTLAFRSVIARVVLHNYETAEAVGLSPRDMQAIHLLQIHGPMTPGELGRAIGLASASTTALIDRLESAGYARRERDHDDRRKVVVSLNEARLASDLAPRYAAQAEQLARAIGRFNAGELHTIGRFLRALTTPESISSEAKGGA